jgi:hypothetical protein
MNLILNERGHRLLGGALAALAGGAVGYGVAWALDAAPAWRDMLRSRRRRHSLQLKVEAEINRRIASGELVKCELIKNGANNGSAPAAKPASPAPDQSAPEPAA